MDFVIFNDCPDMLENVDEFISPPFPVNRVFNWKLTNIEVGFISQSFFQIMIKLLYLKPT